MFLSTETSKSFVYSTYLDIFQQYFEIEMRRVNNELSRLRKCIASNNRMLASTKTIFVDLFIHFRKLYAVVSNEISVVAMLALIDQTYLLLQIISNIDIEDGDLGSARKFKPIMLNLVVEAKDKCRDAAGAGRLNREISKALEESAEVF